jgi:hypothetical protein
MDYFVASLLAMTMLLIARVTPCAYPGAVAGTHTGKADRGRTGLRQHMTKRMLAMEWAMSVEEAIEAEAIAQALCMTTADFTRAFEAFSNRVQPAFQGN